MLKLHAYIKKSRVFINSSPPGLDEPRVIVCIHVLTFVLLYIIEEMTTIPRNGLFWTGALAAVRYEHFLEIIVVYSILI